MRPHDDWRRRGRNSAEHCRRAGRSVEGHLHLAGLEQFLKGKFKGSFLMTVTGGTLDTTAAGTCPDDPDTGNCTTSSWMTQAFGSGATYNGTSFDLTYNACTAGATQWENADTGNVGDICGIRSKACV